MNPPLLPLHVLILAGGRGTRFWPLSRNHRPKQFLEFMGGRTFLQRTVDRLEGLVGPEAILVATSREMADDAQAQLPGISPANFLIEPWGRNTAPCIAWGAVEIARRSGGEAVMAVLPSDHLVTGEPLFQRTLAAAAHAAAQTNALVTIGIQPTRAETAYGYLWVGGELGRWGEMPFHRVKRFVEKPDPAHARSFLERGDYLWNAGMFCWTVDAIRDAYREYLPGTWAAMEHLAHDPHRLEELWESFDATSVDYGVMERSRGVLTVPGRFGWSDVGSWSALPEVVPATEGGWVVAREQVALGAQGNVVHAPDRLVALLGVEDLVVVDTPDALLVARRDRAQDLKALIAEMERRGLTQYL